MAPAINNTITVNAPGSISIAGDTFPETGTSWWNGGTLGSHDTRFASDPLGLCDYEVDGAAEQLCQNAATFTNTPAASPIRLIERLGG